MVIKKVRETKVRHGYYILIMKKLLKNTSMYRFSQGIDYPVIPQHAESQNDDELIPLYKKLGKGNHLIQLHSLFNNLNMFSHSNYLLIMIYLNNYSLHKRYLILIKQA